jgi:hypothetical protein
MSLPSSESNFPDKPQLPRLSNFETWYRCFLGILIVTLFALQKTVEVRATGRAQRLGGYAVSVGFLFALFEFATLFVLRTARRVRDRLGPDRTFEVAVVVTATVLLVANLLSDHLHGYIHAVDQPPPTAGAALVLLGWLLYAAFLLTRRATVVAYFLGFAALLLATRAFAYLVTPFELIEPNQGADMLAAIDRALDKFVAGGFPYDTYPTFVTLEGFSVGTMYYLPLKFLPYVPPKLLHWDLRVTNVALEVLTVAATMFLGCGRSRRAGIAAGLTLPQVALPLFLLYPTWTYYSAITQFPSSVLAAVLWTRAVTAGGAVVQAVTLGLVVATNQTFGLLGFFLGAFWWNRHGWRSAAVLTGVSLATFLLVISPFLLWEPRQFVEVTVFSQFNNPITPDLQPGRFTLVPLVADLFPAAPLVIALGCTALLVLWVLFRARRAESVVAAAAAGYCLALFLLPRGFSHYFLPVIALVLSCPHPADPAASLHADALSRKVFG